MKKPILYIDMDDVLCRFTEAQTEALEQNPAIGFPQSQYGFFRNLKPMQDAISSVQRLRESKRFEVYILTAPSIRNPLCYSEKREWVENYLGMKMVERLIISPNKGLNKGDYLIDDHIFGRGQDQFEGELIHFGSSEFPDWKAVLDYFI